MTRAERRCAVTNELAGFFSFDTGPPEYTYIVTMMTMFLVNSIVDAMEMMKDLDDWNPDPTVPRQLTLHKADQKS